MDKYEYNLKLDEIKKLVTSGNYEGAAKVADSIEWKRVRNTRTLCMISEIYEANDRLEDSKEILLRAYRRSQMTRTVLFRLTEVAIKMKEFDEAVEYYSEFVNAAPNDSSRYILKYEIYKGRGSSLEDQISILEEYKEVEYTEQWGYELCKLYYQAGDKRRCIESCDDLILWFRQGKYVIKALELKKSLTELTPVQQSMYDHREENIMPIKERMEAAVPELEKIIVDKMPFKESEAITENIISETQRELAQAVSRHTAEVNRDIPDQSWRYSTSEKTRVLPSGEVQEKGGMDAGNIPGQPGSQNGAVQEMSMNNPKPEIEFDAEQLQRELAASMREIISGMSSPETDGEIMEPKNDMSFFDESDADVSMEELKEGSSIDDILVSMSGRGETPIAEEHRDSPGNKQADQPQGEALRSEQKEPQLQAAEVHSKNLQQPGDIGRQPGGADPQMGTVWRERSGKEWSEVSKTGRPPVTGAAALEAQTAKLRAEADQAAGLNANLAYHAGISESGPVRTGAEDLQRSRAGEPVQPYSIGDQPINAGAPNRNGTMSGTSGYTGNSNMPGGVMPGNPDYSQNASTPMGGGTTSGTSAGMENTGIPGENRPMSVNTANMGNGMMSGANGAAPVNAANMENGMMSGANGAAPVSAVNMGNPAMYNGDGGSSVASGNASAKNPYQQAAYQPHQSLTLSQQYLFSYFSTIQGLQEQIASALGESIIKVNKDKTSRSGNLVITGDPGSGRTTLGIRFAKALSLERGAQGARVAKIYAEDLNKKDIASTVAKIAGGTLIIEEAGDLSEEVVAQLSKAMEFRTDGLLVILEDEKNYLKELFDRHPYFGEKFTSEISIPIMTNDELVTFGKIYAYDEDYRIDDSAVTALYNQISEMQTPEHPVCIADVRDIVDDAIHRSERAGLRKLGMILSHKRYDDDDRVILYEKDFK